MKFRGRGRMLRVVWIQSVSCAETTTADLLGGDKVGDSAAKQSSRLGKGRTTCWSRYATYTQSGRFNVYNEDYVSCFIVVLMLLA